jgi:hypothetical protein
MYLCLGAVLVGVLTIEEPNAVKTTVGRTPIRIGTVCTICLAVVYWLVYLGLHVFRNRTAALRASEAGTPLATTSFGLEVMKLAATAMNFAPMLCILFLGAQVVADWGGTGLPAAVSWWIAVSTVSVLLQAGLVIAAPLLAKADLQVVGPRGEIDFVTYNHRIFVLTSLLRWVAMIALYLGVAVVCNFLLFTSSEPEMSKAIFRLAALYFAAFLALWLAITAKEFSEGGFARLIRILSIAKDTVMICPMLAALFMEAFIRARWIKTSSGSVGKPQNYVQDYMVIAVFALTAQLLFVCAAGFSSSVRSAQTGGADKITSSPLFLLGSNMAMVVLYLSVLIIVYGIFTINASNANGNGTWLA